MADRAGAAGNRSDWGAVPSREGSLLSDDRLDRQHRFETDVLPHFRGLYASAYRMMGNAQDAEDLVQETFLRAHVALDRLEPGSNTRAWLHTIMQHVRTDDWRRRSRRLKPVALGEDDPPGPHPSGPLVARLDIEQGLLSLPETYRSAVMLRDMEGFSYQEIADILGVALGTVMSRIHRGRALLRGALAGKNT